MLGVLPGENVVKAVYDYEEYMQRLDFIHVIF